MARSGNRALTFAAIVLMAVGLCVLLYPTASDWWNTRGQKKAVTSYVSVVSEADEALIAETLESARAYNAQLAEEGNDWILSEERLAEYRSQLSLDGSSIMGYIEVPKIGATLPVYHGADEAVLQVALGHIEGSSLPVGGASTHSVISGHRGLPSARLFTDLDQMVVGDRFTLHVLGEELFYEVDQILTVEPDDVEALEVVEGEDLCTLVTCTPYGVNSHRLLVRGHRVDASAAESGLVAADAVLVDEGVVALALAAPVFAVAGVCALALRRRG